MKTITYGTLYGCNTGIEDDFVNFVLDPVGYDIGADGGVMSEIEDISLRCAK